MEESHVAVDDYALARVPAHARYSWFPVAMQRFGQISALSQFLLGATLGYGMKFWAAFWAFTVGAVILEIITIFAGIIGQREGLNTSVLARWTGFGVGGSALIGLAITISLVGWFGIQSAVSADGLHAVMTFLPAWAWSLLFGLAITAVVMTGFHAMQWVANITVPLFLILVGWAIISELSKHSFSDLVNAEPAGPKLSFVAATALVAGGFIVGAVITPDMTRFNRSTADVVKQTVLGITLGEYVIGMAGVLLGLAARTDDVAKIIMGSVGWIGVLIIVLGTFKINDWNLYSSGLGIVNFFDTVFRIRFNRGIATAVVGVVGSVLAAAGILGHLTSFLIWLGVAFPPIPGIMIAEYFVVKRFRKVLDDSRAAETLPAVAPMWVPMTLVIWVVATGVGHWVHWGLPSINALVTAFAIYIFVGKLGLLRAFGVRHTEAAAPVQDAAMAE